MPISLSVLTWLFARVKSFCFAIFAKFCTQQSGIRTLLLIIISIDIYAVICDF